MKSVKQELETRVKALASSLEIIETREAESKAEQSSQSPLKPKPVRAGESGPRYGLRNVLKIP